MTTAHLVSLGCAKNRVDSEVILGSLAAAGYRIVTEAAEAQVLLLNTCGFIESAREESVNAILELAAYKKHQCRYLVVCGCLSQRYAAEMAPDLPEVDLFCGVDEIEQVPALLQQLAADGQQRLAVNPRPCGLYSHHSPRLRGAPAASAYIKISEGCDNHCTYCAIPAIRGPRRSRPLGSIVQEAADLVRAGVQEINLIAQDTSAYCADSGQEGLEALLQHLVQLQPPIPWLRLLYLHPKRVTPQLLQTLADLPQLCPYLDLPLQHVNSQILQAMNRGYQRRDIHDLLAAIEQYYPQAVKRTSLIAGFPGETEENFLELLDFVQAGHFQHLGVFAYSPEDDTPAARLPGQVPLEERQRRYQALMAAQQEVAAAWHASKIGAVEPVLVAGYSAETELLLEGRTRYQAPDSDGLVYINAGYAEAGRIVDCRITEAGDYDWVAEVAASAPD